MPGRSGPITESFASKRAATARYHEIKAIKAISPKALTPPEHSGIAFEGLAERYYLEHDVADSTLASDLFRLRVVLDSIGHIDVAGLTEDIMADAIASWKRDRGNSDRGAYRKWEMVRAILRWGKRKKIIAENPLEGFRPERGRPEALMPPTRREVEAILDASPPHLVRAILIAFYTGVRFGGSELFSMTWADFDLASGWVRVRSADKGGLPWRDVPIAPDFRPALEEWKAADDAAGIAWPIHFKGRPVKSVKGAWGAALKRAGIDRRIRPYDLRHFFATDLLEQGVDPGVVAGLMGHTTTRMVQDVYQRVRRAGKENAIKKLTKLSRRDGLPKTGNVVSEDTKKRVQ